jgi:hypothetical protein
MIQPVPRAARILTALGCGTPRLGVTEIAVAPAIGGVHDALTSAQTWSMVVACRAWEASTAQWPLSVAAICSATCGRRAAPAQVQ